MINHYLVIKRFLFKRLINSTLNIENDSLFEKQNKLTDNYKIDKSLNNRKHQLIKRIEFETILKISPNNGLLLIDSFVFEFI